MWRVTSLILMFLVLSLTASCGRLLPDVNFPPGESLPDGNATGQANGLITTIPPTASVVNGVQLDARASTQVGTAMVQRPGGG